VKLNKAKKKSKNAGKVRFMRKKSDGSDDGKFMD
jgi:hypothetical protein